MNAVLLRDDQETSTLLETLCHLAGVQLTAAPLHIIHPREEFVHSLAARARGPLTWLPSNLPMRSTLDQLRLLHAEHTTSDGPSPDVLSPREREILRLVGEGHSDREIAGALALGASTVKTYIQRLKRKLDAGTRAALIAHYQKSAVDDAWSTAAIQESSPVWSHPKGQFGTRKSSA